MRIECQSAFGVASAPWRIISPRANQSFVHISAAETPASAVSGCNSSISCNCNSGTSIKELKHELNHRRRVWNHRRRSAWFALAICLSPSELNIPSGGRPKDETQTKDRTKQQEHQRRRSLTAQTQRRSLTAQSQRRSLTAPSQRRSLTAQPQQPHAKQKRKNQKQQKSNEIQPISLRTN